MGGAEAGPWLPAPGHFYLELREQLGTTAQGFDPGGARRALRTLSAQGSAIATRLYDAQTELYAEIGLATRLALITDFVLLRSLTMPIANEAARSALGLGDLQAGLRLLLVDEEVSCALEAKLGIPTGRSDGALPLGPGDLRGEFSLSIGHAWEKLPFFLFAELGARLRSSGTQQLPAMNAFTAPTKVSIDYASELSYALQLGYAARLGDRFQLVPRATLDGRHGLSAVTDLPPAGPLVDPIHPRSVRMLRVGASLSLGVWLRGARPRRLERVDVQLGGGAFVWGQGLPAVGEVSLAIGLVR